MKRVAADGQGEAAGLEALDDLEVSETTRDRPA